MNDRLSAALVLTLAIGSLPLAASTTGVPLVHVSRGTDDGTVPERVLPGPDTGARLVNTPDGRAIVSFVKPDGAPGRYVNVATRFVALFKFVVRVIPEKPLAGVRAFFGGQEIPRRAGGPAASLDFEWNIGSTGRSTDLVLQLERAEASLVPVTIEIRSVDLEKDVVEDVPPFNILYQLAYLPGAYAGDVLIPAVARAQGAFGPVRSRVAFTNTSGARISLALTFLLAGGGRSNTVPVDVEPMSRKTIDDVLALIFSDPGEANVEGVLAVSGYVPDGGGDLVAETYYERPGGGRLSTVLPLYSSEASPRTSRALLSFSTTGNPKVILFSTRPTEDRGDLPAARFAKLRFFTRSGDSHDENVGIWNGRYGVTRVFGNPSSDDLVTVESDDPFVQAVAVRTDPITGSTTILSSR